MIGPRSLLLLFAVLLFAFLVTALPVPDEGGLVKKSLKQYKVKRGETPTRVARDAAKPSKAARETPLPPSLPSTHPGMSLSFLSIAEQVP
ncbi:hypothetical protein DFH09DRAFT_1366974 [Mycena vulgaris]|nr:hypothetical protein DFH09DRAFT_1366974 [Mycena vulgaris]